MRAITISEEDFRYQLPSNEWLLNKYDEFEEFVRECKKKLEIEEYDIEINHILLFNIFVRIDERKDYFMYFHSEDDSMHMSLGKEIALEAYYNLPERETLQKQVLELKEENEELKKKLRRLELEETIEEVFHGKNNHETLGDIIGRNK